jgi:hypothetical protein
MTKNELLPLAKTYFDSNKDLKEIFGTEDKHFWYKEIQAVRFCKGDKLYFKFTPEDFEEKKVKLTPKQILQKEAADLEIEFNEKTSSSDLKVLIDIKKEETK